MNASSDAETIETFSVSLTQLPLPTVIAVKFYLRRRCGIPLRLTKLSSLFHVVYRAARPS